MLFTHFNKLKKNIKIDQEINDIPTIFRFYSEIQSLLFNYFHDYLDQFFPMFIDFLSKIDNENNIILNSTSFKKVIQEILNACNKNQGNACIEYFETQINDDFFNILKEDSNFDIYQCINANASDIFKDFKCFIVFLNKIKAIKLFNLIMIKVYHDFIIDRSHIYNLFYFKNIYYYNLFIEAEKVVFKLPKLQKNASLQTIAKHKKIYDQITDFFDQYVILGIPFFEFKSKIEIVTSNDKPSISYPSIYINSITKVFPISPSFESFIRIAFFKYAEHKFQFDELKRKDWKDIFIYFPSYRYRKNEKPTGGMLLYNYSPKHYIYPDKMPFSFDSSTSLPKRIAVVRFLTYFVRSYLSLFQIKEYYPKPSFSCGFSKIPSELLINFITLSILPNSDYLPSDLKLKNDNFLNILQFSYLIFQNHSMNKQSKQICINNNRFEFIAFFSITLSSKIRFILAQNILKILSNKKNFHNSINIFSIKELEYAQKFIKSNQLDKSGEIISDSEITKLFLNKLFSTDFIQQYYNITPENSQKSERLKKLHEFNLQKMFIDLESSVLNILPCDIFLISAIYSYLLLNNHTNLDKNLSQKNEIQFILDILSQLFNKNICIKVETKLKAFNNSISDIIQFCDHYIFARLQGTFDFLQSFYKSYYFISFCKVSNRYQNINTKLKIFLDKINKMTSIENFINSMTEKLKPFPLFCLPFFFYSHHLSLSSYIEKLDEIFTNIDNFPNSSTLLEPENFYSQQFRIHLSNLSLYSEFKKSVIEGVDILNRFINDENNNDIMDFLSSSFFQISSSSTNSMQPTEIQKENTLKNAIEFCVGYNFEAPLKKSIYAFIEQFKSKMNEYLNFDLENTTKLISNNIDDFQFFFISDENNNNYIDSILNNLKNLINSLSISNKTISFDKKEENHDDTVRLVFYVLGARFNNEVEIDPIVQLIPDYEEKLCNPNYSINPTNKEFMALCSALSFTFSPKDKFKDRVFKKSILLNIEDEDTKDESYLQPDSASNSLIKVDNTNYNSSPIMQNVLYEKAIQEAFLLSDIDILKIRDKYDVRLKRWGEIIWDIFFDFFNKKLKDINLSFDLNDKYSQESSYFNCFANENKIIMEYLPQLVNLPDLHEKEYWIGRFLNLHKNYEPDISICICSFIELHIS